MEHTEDEALVTLGTRVPKALHRRLMLHCVSSETLLMDFVTMALREKLAASSGTPVAVRVKGYSRNRR
jgi:hypothetical protein